MAIIANRQWKIRSYIWVNVTVILCLFANLYLFGIPQPSIHDEFSYLLGGDTFANGRFANPEHPKKEFFHTFHVLQSPVYASKYPPGSFLFIAIGIWLGNPFFGIWIQALVFGNAMLWACYVFLGNRWAPIAAIAAVLQFCFANYWVLSYWGGLTAAIGGCLAFGGFWKCLSASSIGRRQAAVFCGIGLVLLMITRPYEGLVATASAFSTFYCAAILIRKHSFANIFQRFLPTLFLVTLGFIFVLYYNYTITNKPLRFPQSEFSKQYFNGSPIVSSKTKRFVSIDVGQFKSFYDYYLKPNDMFYKLEDGVVRKSKMIFSFFFFHYTGIVVLLAIPLCWSQKAGFLLLPMIAAWIADVLIVPFMPHYIAPIAPIFVILQFLCLRALVLRLPEYRYKILVFILLLLCIFIFQLKQRISVPEYINFDFLKFANQRMDIESTLRESDQYDCVLVRYSTSSSYLTEWVYNLSNTDEQHVVWAHDLGEKNIELMQYYPERRFWRLTVGAGSIDLQEMLNE